MYEDNEAALGRIFRNTYQPVKPISCYWGNKEITITEIGFSHTYAQGTTIHHVFSCSDGVNFYQLTFDHKDIPLLARQLKG